MENLTQSHTPIVFRWDLDKTYLQTEFESLRELVRIPFEKPEDKVTIPGVIPLIHGLRRVAEAQGRVVGIYFISASPPQIGKAIRDKLALDGVQVDGIIFKNQLRNIRRGKFRNLREQIGYKLTELLKQRASFPPDCEEIMFGDDWESDPVIYSLYADVINGRVSIDELREILTTAEVDEELVGEACELAAQLEHVDSVRRIYINLERRTAPTEFARFSDRLVPAFDYFQTAVCLFSESILDEPAVAAVAQKLIEASAYTPARLANSLNDLRRRVRLDEPRLEVLRESLMAAALLPAPPVVVIPRPSFWQRAKKRLRALAQRWRHKPVVTAEPPAALQIDYRALMSEWRQLREGAVR